MQLELGEIQTFVSNLERAISFYEEKLGLNLKNKTDKWAIFDISGTEFVLMSNARHRD